MSEAVTASVVVTVTLATVGYIVLVVRWALHVSDAVRDGMLERRDLRKQVDDHELRIRAIEHEVK